MVSQNEQVRPRVGSDAVTCEQFVKKS